MLLYSGGEVCSAVVDIDVGKVDGDGDGDGGSGVDAGEVGRNGGGEVSGS